MRDSANKDYTGPLKEMMAKASPEERRAKGQAEMDVYLTRSCVMLAAGTPVVFVENDPVLAMDAEKPTRFGGTALVAVQSKDHEWFLLYTDKTLLEVDFERSYPPHVGN